MFTVGIGQSEDPLASAAVSDVIDQVKKALGDVKPQAGLLFCSLDFDHAYILSNIREAFPGIQIAGCTTDGELSSVYGFTEDSVVLIAFASDTAEISAGAGKEMSRNGKSAGRSAARSALESLSRCAGEERFAVILSDPLNAGVSDVSSGMEEALGESFPLIGAASAAHSKLKTTYQFFNDEVLTDSVVLLLFAGAVEYSFGVLGGHAPMGEKERITSSKKNVIYRIGGKPALDYFRRYIGDKHSLFLNYCLAIYEEGRESFYVRSAPFSDEQTGSVTLNGVVEKGAMVQIGTADRNSCEDSCAKSIRAAIESYLGGKPSAALFFSCAGRKMIMGRQVVKETETAKRMLDNIPFCGFYSYGEFCPLERDGKPLFHGTTFVTLLIGGR
jgi:hypothetical protein